MPDTDFNFNAGEWSPRRPFTSILNKLYKELFVRLLTILNFRLMNAHFINTILRFKISKKKNISSLLSVIFEKNERFLYLIT